MIKYSSATDDPDRGGLQTGVVCRQGRFADRSGLQTGVVCRQDWSEDRSGLQTGVVCKQVWVAHDQVEAKNRVRYNAMCQECSWHNFSF